MYEQFSGMSTSLGLPRIARTENRIYTRMESIAILAANAATPQKFMGQPADFRVDSDKSVGRFKVELRAGT